MLHGPHADRVLMLTLATLVIGGFFIFLSASLGLFASSPTQFSQAAKSQVFLGLGGGCIAFLIGMKIPYRFWRRYSLFLFVAALLATFLVFLPHIGLSINGAHRWIAIGSITVQPSELLKIAYILYLATWFSGVKNKINDMRYGFLPFCIITGLVGTALVIQPDNDTFLVTALAGLAMFIVAGATWRDLALLGVIGLIGVVAIVSFRPYVAERITTFLHPGNDSQGAGYQIQQSLLAVGAGEVFGRGFGQSIQKFGKLPEPTSDSIFSVFSEEFGFVGSASLIIIYVIFALRGFWVAARAPDMFGGLVAAGIVTLIMIQSFVNIGAMLGVIPLSGLPLVFISRGGTSLLIFLGAAGILLSVSKSVRA